MGTSLPDRAHRCAAAPVATTGPTVDEQVLDLEDADRVVPGWSTRRVSRRRALLPMLLR
jgi:hypothetical protein